MWLVCVECDAEHMERRRPNFIKFSKVARPFAGWRAMLLCAVAHQAGG